ncbi:hypothetical protein GCM10027347_44420 [Larkinella harenae]
MESTEHVIVSINDGVAYDVRTKSYTIRDYYSYVGDKETLCDYVVGILDESEEYEAILNDDGTLTILN